VTQPTRNYWLTVKERLAQPGCWGKGGGLLHGKHCLDTMMQIVAADGQVYGNAAQLELLYRARGQVGRKIKARHNLVGCASTVWNWNDQPERTLQEVLDLCQALAEESTNGEDNHSRSI